MGKLDNQAAIDAALIGLAVDFKACAREKDGLVQAVDAFNAAVVAPRRWWEFR